MWTPLPTVLLSIFAGYVETNAYTFTEQEDEDLRQVLWGLGAKFSWKKVSACMQFRNVLECCVRWHEMQNMKNKKKGHWMPEEDSLMKSIVKHRGASNWRLIACYIPGRTFKQCRERWHNHLNPKINKENWTAQETQIVMDMQRVHGNKWATIAKYIPGRTDNMVKNRWYIYCAPTLEKCGISFETSSLHLKDGSPQLEKNAIPPATFSPDTMSYFSDLLQESSVGSPFNCFDSSLDSFGSPLNIFGSPFENILQDPFSVQPPPSNIPDLIAALEDL